MFSIQPSEHLRLTNEERADHLTNRCLTIDSRLKGFYMKGWRAECEFDLEYDGTEDIHIHSNSLTPVEDGSIEIDIILNKKPLKNIFYYTLTSKNLNFLYQPELTKEEIDRGDFRPINVVGSYAVYHKTKANNRKNPNGTEYNYKTGKAFHIYRPKARDANKVEVWCNILIKNNKLSIEVPQDFLNGATYPVTIDPDVGYTSVGASNGTFPNCRAHRAAAQQYTASTGDTLTSYSLHYHSYGGAATWEGAVYDTSSNVPVNWIAIPTSTAEAIASPGSWSTSAAVSHSLTNGNNYTIAYNAVSGTVRIQYDSGGTNTSSDDSNGSLRDPWVEVGSAGDYISMYFTYTAGGGGNVKKINIGDTWKDIDGYQINIGDTWKVVAGIQQNIGDSWKTIF